LHFRVDESIIASQKGKVINHYIIFLISGVLYMILYEIIKSNISYYLRDILVYDALFRM